MPQRLELLKRWLSGPLALPEYDINPASADASFRRYFRITTADRTYVAMDAPPDKENTGPYIHIARHLFEIGLNVPEIIQVNEQQGFLLLSDLGSQQYLSALNGQSVAQLYGDAMNALLVLQEKGAVDDPAIPPYDRTLLMNEMGLFRDWYLQKHLGLTLDSQELALLDKAFSLLADSALAQPRVLVHRDYHSRNLMVTERRNPGVLDFQDAVVGAVTYDLVSLLRDCYIAWPRHQVEQWVAAYQQQAQARAIIPAVEQKQFLAWFDLMGVQRHLKATGIFARLNIRDGKPGYLNDIPRTLGYVLAVLPDYSDLADFYDFLQRRVQPRLAA